MLRFGFEEMLFGYLLIPVIGILLWHAVGLKRKAVQRFGDVELMAKLSRVVSRRARLAKSLLLLGTIFFLISALSRPQFGTRVETVMREGRDIVIAIDVSASMLAEDIAPNRLEKAKHAVGSLIGRLEGDRVALVAFAGTAFVQSPLTLDYGAATMFLNAMGPDLIPVPGTAVNEALSTALGVFVAGESQHKILILITDGEDHEGDIQERVREAAEAGVVIHTVGIGSTQGVPIPELDPQGGVGGFATDENGEIVLTRLDEETLQDIARGTDGSYYHATAGEDELRLLANDIAEAGEVELASQEITQFEEQYQIFLGLAIFLLTLEVLVPERRRLHSAWTGRFQ